MGINLSDITTNIKTGVLNTATWFQEHPKALLLAIGFAFGLIVGLIL